MSPQAFRYRWLWKRLKQKYFPEPSVFIVHGRYHVAHESGYDWIIGYCTARAVAEELANLLHRELQWARKQLGSLHAFEREASKELREYRFEINFEERDKDPEYVKLRNTWIVSSDAFRDKIDEIMLTMTDKDIPFPYSHIMGRPTSYDGPIQYYVEEVIKCRTS